VDPDRIQIADSLWLTSHDDFPVEQRFLDAFRRVWKKRKRSERNELLEFWRQRDANRGIVPIIKLVPTLLPGKADPTEVRYGHSDEGMILEFAATLIENMPDGLIEVLISHELLHAARKAGNRETNSRTLEELAVRMENDKMGYDENALTNWMRRNRPR
jgi:hypothetical protein